MSENSQAVQAPEAAPAGTPAPNPAASIMVDAPPGQRMSQPEDTSGLPTNLDDIEALFAGKGNVQVPNEAIEPAHRAKAAAAPVTPEPGPLSAAPAAPVTEAPAVEAPLEAAPEAPVAPEAVSEPVLPNRIPTAKLDPLAKRALAVQHEMNSGLNPGDAGYTSLRDVMNMLDTTAPKAEAPVARPSPIDVSKVHVEAAKEKVTQARAALKDLSTKRAELVEYGQDTADIDQQITDATEGIANAVVDARLAEHNVIQTQQTEAQRAAEADRQARVKYQAKAMEQYPSVADVNSPLWGKVDQMAKAMKDPMHPSHNVLWSQNSAEIVTQMAATELAQEMSAKGGTTFADALASLMATPKAAAPVASVQDRRVLPAAGAAPTSQAPPPLTGEELLAQAGTDPEALETAFANSDKPFGGKAYMAF